MIETVSYPELTAIGFMVEATREELPAAVSAAWERLFAADSGATSFAAVTLPEENGLRRELVGFLAARATEIPPGMVRIDLDAGRYLRLIHDGPVSAIPDGFARLQAHAAANGLKVSGIALDFGHRPGLPDGRHELHLALAAQLPALG